MESKPIQLSVEKGKKKHYKFMFWTTLLPIYYTKNKPEGVYNNMKVNFMDNARNYIYEEAQSNTYNNKAGDSL